MPILDSSISSQLGTDVWPAGTGHQTPGASPGESAAQEHGWSDDQEVFVIRFTGEPFGDYQQYIDWLALYRMRVWQCRYTRRQKLTYEEALESERANGPAARSLPDTHEQIVVHHLHHNTATLKDIINELHDLFVGVLMPGELVRVKGTVPKSSRAARVIRRLPAAGQPQAAGASPAPLQSNRPPSDQSATGNDVTDSGVPAAAADNSSPPLAAKLALHVNPGLPPASQDSDVYEVELIASGPGNTGTGTGGSGAQLQLTGPRTKQLKRGEITRKQHPLSKQKLRTFIQAVAERPGTFRGSPFCVTDPELIARYGLPEELPAALAAAVARGLAASAAADSAARRSHAGSGAASNGAAVLPNQGPQFPVADEELAAEHRAGEGPRPLPNGSLSPELLAALPAECTGDLLFVWRLVTSFSRPLALSPFDAKSLAHGLSARQASPLLTELHFALVRVLVDDELEVRKTATGPDGDEDSDRTAALARETKENPFDGAVPSTESWTEFVPQVFHARADRMIDVDTYGPDLSSSDRVSLVYGQELLDTLVLMERNGYYGLSAEARLLLLRHLANDVLTTGPVRRAIDQTNERIVDHRRSQHKERRKLAHQRKLLKERRNAALATVKAVGTGSTAELSAQPSSSSTKDESSNASLDKQKKHQQKQQQQQHQQQQQPVDQELDRCSLCNELGHVDQECAAAGAPGAREFEERIDAFDQKIRQLRDARFRSGRLGQDRDFSQYFWFAGADGQIWVESVDAPSFRSARQDAIRQRADAREAEVVAERKRKLESLAAQDLDDSDDEGSSSGEGSQSDPAQRNEKRAAADTIAAKEPAETDTKMKTDPATEESSEGKARLGSDNNNVVGRDDPATEDQGNGDQGRQRKPHQHPADLAMPDHILHPTDIPFVAVGKTAQRPVSVSCESWAAYERPEAIPQLLQWLNPKGKREQGLRKRLERQREKIDEAMTKHWEQVQADATSADQESKSLSLRQSTRLAQTSRASCHMQYVNKLARAFGPGKRRRSGGRGRSSAGLTGDPVPERRSARAAADVAMTAGLESSGEASDNGGDRRRSRSAASNRKKSTVASRADRWARRSRRQQRGVDDDDDDDDDDDNDDDGNGDGDDSDVCAFCQIDENDSQVLLCDGDCGRAFHTYCLYPPLQRIPRGDWFCSDCAPDQHDQGQRRSSTRRSTRPRSPEARRPTRGKRTRRSMVVSSSEPDSSSDSSTPSDDTETESGSISDDAACETCQKTTDGAKMLLCDECGAGHHMFCLDPPLTKIPDGDWYCPNCL